ncbi:MAG: hypothetical protein LBE38_11755 [Deltaproteobacteria bacterium]|nr:hypothetical protein [Deltaproteobacteria bacterium]
MTAKTTPHKKGEPFLLETLKLKGGKYYNVPQHMGRIERAYAELLGSKPDFELKVILPPPPDDGFYRVRVPYPNKTGIKVEIIPYSFPKVKTLKIVYNEDLEYSFKYLDRGGLAKIKEGIKEDDFVICRKGSLTDTSVSNVVLENEEGYYTPLGFLLDGVKRNLLIESGKVKVCPIGPGDVKKYRKLYFINAMIDLEDNISVLTENITI